MLGSELIKARLPFISEPLLCGKPKNQTVATQVQEACQVLVVTNSASFSKSQTGYEIKRWRIGLFSNVFLSVRRLPLMLFDALCDFAYPGFNKSRMLPGASLSFARFKCSFCRSATFEQRNVARWSVASGHKCPTFNFCSNTKYKQLSKPSLHNEYCRASSALLPLPRW